MKSKWIRAVLVVLVTITIAHFFISNSEVISVAQEGPNPEMSHSRTGSGTPPRRRGFLDSILPSGDRADDTNNISAEQMRLFTQVKKEIQFCTEKELSRAIRSCPYIQRRSTRKPTPDKECVKVKKVEVGLKCENKLLGRIPYRSRPAWTEYRASKIEKDKAKLEKLRSKQGSHSREAPQDGEWLTEF